MPNTLAHIGIQTLMTRGVLRDADVKWIWTGCVIPDFPWIVQRVVRAAIQDVPPIDLRLYAIAQSSLLFCLVASASLACLSGTRWRTFGILAAGSLVHLILDAMQTKWANGVVLFAPFRWNLTNFGLFWPEDMATLLLTLLGVATVILAFARWRRLAVWNGEPGKRSGLAALVISTVYFAGPYTFMSGIEAADLHFTATLRETIDRTDRPIAFDRAVTRDGDLFIWTGERLDLSGRLTPGTGTYSVKGRFDGPQTVEVVALHGHPQGLRDFSAYIGLASVTAWWSLCLIGRVRRTRRA